MPFQIIKFIAVYNEMTLYENTEYTWSELFSFESTL
jgi:hypothetical protein